MMKTFPHVKVNVKPTKLTLEEAFFGHYSCDNHEALGYYAECARKILNGGDVIITLIPDQKKANTIALRESLKNLLLLLDDET